MKIFQVLAALMLLLLCCGATSEIQESPLPDDYAALADDVKWFFQGLNQFAAIIEQMLPNVTASSAQSRSFTENTRVTLLFGLRHLLVGVREIAMTFEQSFNTDHVKQLHQLKNATEMVKQLIMAIKRWFSHIRAFVARLMHLYNRYVPEVLFGKCLGSYLATTYPERSYYQYPFLLLSEIFTTIITKLASQRPTSELAIQLATELPARLPDTDLNVAQNEISRSYVYEYNSSYGFKSPRQLAATSSASAASSESLFDFSSVLNENNQQSWQQCLKLYTVESISRSLKLYFLDTSY